MSVKADDDHTYRPARQVSFYAAASVAPPKQLANACGGRAVAGGWASGQPARLMISTHGRLEFSFPGDPSLAYRPEEGGTRWC